MGFRRKRAQPALLQGLVRQVYPDRRDRALRLIAAIRAWDTRILERIRKVARPVRVEGATLVVHTTHSTWCQELEAMKSDLLEALLQERGHGIRALKFLVGPMPEIRVEEEVTRKHRAVTELPPELARMLASVEQDELRETVAQAALASLAASERNK